MLTLLGELVCVCWHHPPFSGSTPANPAGTATKFKCEVFGEQDFHQFPFPACSNRGGIRDGEQFFAGAYSLDAWVCELLTQPSCCYFKTVTTPDIWRFHFFCCIYNTVGHLKKQPHILERSDQIWGYCFRTLFPETVSAGYSNALLDLLEKRILEGHTH